MKQAIGAYRSVSASPEFREMERMRSKARHDEAQALENAVKRAEEKWGRVIADKDAALANMDTVIANQSAEIERLRKLLAESNKTKGN